jgi:AcrR family transcriptional regulator
LNTFNSMLTAHSTTKGEDTALRILDAALDLFREQGFEEATMRQVAEKAGVATGAAYYYYPSKDAIVMAFYQRASGAMHPEIEEAVVGLAGLEARLRALIGVKLAYFAPNRGVLRALLRSGADPRHPLSPFSVETATIRASDIAWFARILDGCGTRIPRDLQPHLPGVLWFFQMGIIFYWVIDDSPEQAKTARLLELSTKVVASLVRASSLPLMRPLRRTATHIIELVKGE